MYNPTNRDVDLTVHIEQELKHGLSNVLSNLIVNNENPGARHIMAAVSTFFTTTLAVLLPAEAWAQVFESLKSAIPEMEVYRKDYLARRDLDDLPAAPAGDSDTNSN